MLAAAVESAGLETQLDAVLSVDPLRTFKPNPAVYALAEDRLGIARKQIAFFSSNGWDVTHAAQFGFAAIWVNRAKAPPDRVGAAPKRVLCDLANATDVIAAL